MVPVRPGRILKRELATPGPSANKLALALHVPPGRVTAILNGKRAVSPDTALRLARSFGNSARFWMNPQTRHDLTVAEIEIGRRVDAEVEHAAYNPRTVILQSPDENRVRGYQLLCHSLMRALRRSNA